MNYIQTITKIRDRGQLTSHPQHQKKKLTKKEWDKIWKIFEDAARSGRQDIKLTDFLRHDRDMHF